MIVDQSRTLATSSMPSTMSKLWLMTTLSAAAGLLAGPPRPSSRIIRKTEMYTAIGTVNATTVKTESRAMSSLSRRPACNCDGSSWLLGYNQVLVGAPTAAQPVYIRLHIYRRRHMQLIMLFFLQLIESTYIYGFSLVVSVVFVSVDQQPAQRNNVDAS